MEVRFADKSLEKILNNERLIKKHFNQLANKIMMRMSEFKAAKDLSEITHLPPPRRHKLEGYENVFAVDVSKNFRIKFKSVDSKIIELKEIKEIIILAIEDYH